MGHPRQMTKRSNSTSRIKGVVSSRFRPSSLPRYNKKTATKQVPTKEVATPVSCSSSSASSSGGSPAAAAVGAPPTAPAAPPVSALDTAVSAKISAPATQPNTTANSNSAVPAAVRLAQLRKNVQAQRQSYYAKLRGRLLPVRSKSSSSAIQPRASSSDKENDGSSHRVGIVPFRGSNHNTKNIDSNSDDDSSEDESYHARRSPHPYLSHIEFRPPHTEQQSDDQANEEDEDDLVSLLTNSVAEISVEAVRKDMTGRVLRDDNSSDDDDDASPTAATSSESDHQQQMTTLQQELTATQHRLTCTIQAWQQSKAIRERAHERELAALRHELQVYKEQMAVQEAAWKRKYDGTCQVLLGMIHNKKNGKKGLRGAVAASLPRVPENEEEQQWETTDTPLS